MQNVIILAQYLGVLYFVISFATLIKQDKVHAMLQSLRDSKGAFFGLGTLVFSLGLLLVMIHGNYWQGFAGIATGIIAWGAICESLLYLFLPHRSLAGIMTYIDDENVLTASSIIGIGIGISLLIVGLQII